MPVGTPSTLYSHGPRPAGEVKRRTAMRRRLTLLVFGLLWGAGLLWAQDVPVGVVVAFKKGSSQDLDRYMGQEVELIMPSQTTRANKQQALDLMSAFFAGNKVNTFNVNHQGKRDESSFMVGTLATAGGTYRVNCFFRRIQNRYEIQQIRIDKAND